MDGDGARWMFRVSRIECVAMGGRRNGRKIWRRTRGSRARTSTQLMSSDLLSGRGTSK